MKEESISITTFRDNYWDIYFKLLKIAKRTGRKSHVSSVLHELGFKTIHTQGIEEKLIEELRKRIPLEMAEEAVRTGRSPIKIAQIKDNCKCFNNYIDRRLRNPTLPHIRRIYDRLYPQYPHLAPFITGIIKLKDFSIEEVKDILLNRYYSGEDISWTGLSDVEKGLIKRWLIVYSSSKHKKGIFRDRGKRDLTKVVSELTGIKSRNFSIKNSKKLKDLGNISENFVRMVLWSALKIDPMGKNQTELFRESYPLPITKIYPINGKENTPTGLRLEFIPKETEDTKIYSDIVVESLKDTAMVEVKNFKSIDNDNLKRLRDRFCNEGRTLICSKEGKEITRKVLVALSREDICKKISDYLKDTDVRVISSLEFRKSLEITVKELEKNGYIRTQVYSPEEILKMYNLFNESSHILIRQSHKSQLNFLDESIKELIDRVQEGDKPKEHEPIKIYSRTGDLKENKKGMFQQFKLSLEDISDSHAKEYVQKRIKNIPEEILFLDIESTGFVGNLIFLIGMMYKQEKDLKIELCFARNPLEEEAILEHFSNKLRNYKDIVTFNGYTFDIPAIQDRFIANMIRGKLPKEHIDLYNQLIKNRELHKKIESKKLYHICELFGDEREDVMGYDVPLLYSNWLRNGNPKQIENILRHNVLDLITLGAVYLSPNLLGINH